jgi:DNA-binding NtrC family response regulator
VAADRPTRRLADSAPPSGPLLPLRITIVAGPDKGRTQVVDQPRVLIGRGETADVQVHDETVSQCHAELLVTERGLLVRDLDSVNGVISGDVRVVQALIRPGCALALGATVLLVEPAGGPADARPVDTPSRSFGSLVGEAPAMRALYSMLERLARTDLSVLIQGQTGTGKELAARALHAAGARAEGPFMVLDCTTIPATLATSFLFGHEKGAFTGATERRIGVFEAAHGGVLFMDEVGELSADLQPLLLRVLQHREVTPVGSTRPRPVDIRVISATWRDLRAMVNQGTFREDLYYRLAQATLWMPSLAERKEDIGLLVQHFLGRMPRSVIARSIAPAALAALAARPFPGNVRELQNTVERLARLAEGPVITEGDLAFERMLAAERKGASSPGLAPPRTSAAGPVPAFKTARRTMIDEFERNYLVRLLQRAGNNLSRAAALAELERHNLRDLLKRHGLYSPKE